MNSELITICPCLIFSHDSNDESDVEDDDNPVEEEDEEENDSSSDIVCID